jgi:Arc/MetJ family transcription regulator
VAVPKRLIDLDDDLLKEAQRELGTTGVSDTVRARYSKQPPQRHGRGKCSG